MLNYRLFAISALFALSPVVAHAEAVQAVASTASITPGAFLKTADGKRAGQIFSVDKAADGSITGAALIGSDSTLVHVPVSTITAVDKSHFTTSLTYNQIFH